MWDGIFIAWTSATCATVIGSCWGGFAVQALLQKMTSAALAPQQKEWVVMPECCQIRWREAIPGRDA
jgi:hypothetical protein